MHVTHFILIFTLLRVVWNQTYDPSEVCPYLGHHGEENRHGPCPQGAHNLVEETGNKQVRKLVKYTTTTDSK